jgi:chaperonin GroES
MGIKAARASRIGEHMSYQIMEEMQDWEEDTDRLLMILSIAGTVFRKTYYDPITETNCSKLVLPRDLVVNYWTRSTVEEARRKTQRLYMTKNDVQERINAGIFLKDVDLGDPTSAELPDVKNVNRSLTIPDDDEVTTPYLILEQHTWLDLDEDGYREPYVVTFEHKTKQILRIAPRFSVQDVKVGEDGNIIKIESTEYFTKYGFIPNPDGGFYDLGFGVLLGALNESANTLVNQLIDAGSLSNLQSGFIAKGMRLKLGEARFQPGEWKAVNATGDDLRKGIFPLPTRDPSNVLFQLLGMIVQSTKELASVAEIFVGKMPGQNTPATTTQATVEQGMKVFTSIFKRVYRSMTKEFRKLYKLNRMYIDPQSYQDVLDNPASAQDYQGPDNDIVPAADPQAQTDAMKQQKAQAILQAVQMGGLNPQAAMMRFLEANSVEDIEQLMPPKDQQQPPPPEVQKMQMEMQFKQQEAQMKQQMAQADMQMKQQMLQMEMQIEQQRAQIQLQVEQAKLEMEKIKLQLEMQRAELEIKVDQQKAQMAVQQAGDKLVMGRAMHQQKLDQNASKQQQQVSNQSGLDK